jgi:hypothetical protein
MLTVTVLVLVTLAGALIDVVLYQIIASDRRAQESEGGPAGD